MSPTASTSCWPVTPKPTPRNARRCWPRGFQSRLSLPVSAGGIRVGTLQAFASRERPWTRFQVSRARVIALALGATLTRTGALGSPEADAGPTAVASAS